MLFYDTVEDYLSDIKMLCEEGVLSITDEEGLKEAIYEYLNLSEEDDLNEL